MPNRRFVIALVLLFSKVGAAQEFEVASIRAVDPNLLRETCGGSKRGRQGGPGTQSPERVSYTCQGLARLVVEAYGFDDYHFYRFSNLGLVIPESNLVSISATMKSGTTTHEYQAMLRNLLAESFHLKAHKELRESSVYELTVGKNGHKLKENRENPDSIDLATVNLLDANKDAEGFAILPPIPGHVVLTGGKIGHSRLVGNNVSLNALIEYIEAILKGPIIDRSGLDAKYDFQLDFDAGYAPPPGMNVDSLTFYPLIPQALNKQLGLVLEKKKGQVEFVVIDSIDQKPTAN